MKSCTCFLLAAFTICLASVRVSAQEGQPGSRPPGSPDAATATGPDKKYVELSHSKDRVIKATAERYLNLIKFQEWGGASGKTQIAKYVSHDPDLKQVKLSIARGTGKDRVLKEFDVQVATLNKTCQARVKQIDFLQKRLDELASTAAGQGDGTGRPGGAEGPGARTAHERVAHPPEGQGPEGTAAVPGAPPPHPEAPPQASAPEADASALEPDPIGFAELPPITPTAVGAPPTGPGSLPPATPAAAGPAPVQVPSKAGNSSDRKQWRTSLAAFASNITAGTDPTGKPLVNWGELRELREMNDIAVAQRSPEPPARSPEAESPAAISERLGDMHWQLVVDKVDEAPGGLVVPSFHPVDLAKPVEIHVVLDETEDVQKWSRITPGSTVNVSARLSISEPYKLTAKVKLAGAK
jgi:hypothetical protein